MKAPLIPTCEPWGLSELLEREKEVVGIYISAHPLDGFKFEMTHFAFTNIAEIESLQGKSVRIAGFVSEAATPFTKKGTQFGKFLINDYTGHHEITLWNDQFAKWKPYVDNGQKLVIDGTYAEHRFRPGVFEFSVSNITLLESARKTMTKKLSLLLPLQKLDADLVRFFNENVRTNPGNTDLSFVIVDEESEHQTRLKTQLQKISLNDDLINLLHERDYIRYAVELVS